jgi:enoyl-[acyl-carrier protein] reductase I
MTDSRPLMAGKRGLVMGLANDRSIAYGIAKAVAAQGADLAITYQVEGLEKRVRPLAEEMNASIITLCDLMVPEQVDALFAEIAKRWGKIDFVVHAVAFSDKNELTGDYVATTRGNFLRTMDVSVYSFTDLAQRALPLMTDGGSLLTLTYYGAERVMPHYNVMGVAKAALEASVRYLAADLGKRRIRVNAISAGPIKTLAASGIGDFRYILKWNEFNSPMRRNVTIDEVGGTAVYLLSDLGTGVTGEVLHVDCGYHVVGMLAVDAVPKVSELLAEFKPKS